MPYNGPKLSDSEFEELARQLDAKLNSELDRLCAEYELDRDKTFKHVSSTGKCYCACGTSGPCQHDWTGPWIEIENGGSISCSKCGMLSIDHSMHFF